MPDDTPNLSLPLLLPAQAQKHVTHNEALQMLDVLVQLTVLDRDRSSPPDTPAEGDCHIIASGAGEWTGQSGRLAAWMGGAWIYLEPAEGWSAWVIAENRRVIRLGGIWSDGAALPGAFAQLGVSTGADAVNRLAVAAPATLFTHAGAGHQLKLNKAAPADTVSLLYQSNWSGRAEIGLAGSDALSVKVSADGGSWATAAAFDGGTGAAALAAGLTIGGQLGFHRGNVLGSVAQSAGVPTGALIEQGSTAAGRFLRFADGAQICSHVLTGATGAGVTWTYPRAFAAAPTVTGTAQAVVLSGLVLDLAPSATAAVISARDTANARRADSLHLLAIGRWF